MHVSAAVCFSPALIYYFAASEYKGKKKDKKRKKWRKRKRKDRGKDPTKIAL